MGREYELKYQASQEILARIRQDYQGFVTIAMQTDYYDTPAADFYRRKWALRQRRENEEYVCTLKVPLPDGSRGEWELPGKDLMAALPGLVAQGAPAELLTLAKAGLRRTAGARFVRLAKTLSVEGCTLELALDAGHLLGSGRTLAFAEVEVELKAGSEIAAVAFAQHLAERYGLRREPLSKIQRAMALRYATD